MSEDGTIISRLSSCGFTYLIPLPLIEARGPKLFVFLWPVVGGSYDISLLLGPLAPEALPVPTILLLCWFMLAPPAGVPLLMYISLSWFLREECLICIAPPPPLVVTLFDLPFCK